MPAKDGPQLYKFTDLLSGYAADGPIGYTRTFDFARPTVTRTG
jgi:hypothetical protein